MSSDNSNEKQAESSVAFTALAQETSMVLATALVYVYSEKGDQMIIRARSCVRSNLYYKAIGGQFKY